MSQRIFAWIVLIALLSISSEAWTAGLDYRVVPAISSRAILPTTRLSELGDDREVEVQLARGEFESASFVVRIDGERSLRITAEISDLQSDDSTISASAIDLKYVVAWYQASGAWSQWRRAKKNWEAELVPELLVNDPTLVRVDRVALDNYLKIESSSGPEYRLISKRAIAKGNVYPRASEFAVMDLSKFAPVDLAPHVSQQYWITVRTPLDAKPGDYLGSIKLTAGDELLAQIPMKLKVLRFDLLAPSLEYSIYYRGQLEPDYPSISHAWKSDEQLAADLRAMVDHGISNPTCYQRFRVKMAVEGASNYSRLELLDRYLRIRAESGIVDLPLYYLGRLIGRGSGAKEREHLRRDLEVLKEVGDRHRVNGIYLYGVDEAKGKSVSDQMPAWRFVRSLGVRVFAAGRGSHVADAAGLTNLLIYRGDEKIAKQMDAIRAQHAAGNRIFMYGNPQTGPENPAIWRLNYGIELWRMGYDGAMPFAYQSQFGDIWNDWDNRIYRTEAFAYPAVDGPIVTIAFAGFREAVDDVRYLTTLEKEIELRRQRDPNPGEEDRELQSAVAFLNAVRMGESRDPDTVRRMLIFHLQALGT
jgi:hypothetical protein